LATKSIGEVEFLVTKSICEVEFLATKSKYILRRIFSCEWISSEYFYIFFTPKFGLEFFDEVNFPTIIQTIG
jgi:hypothetical protein